MSLDDLHLRPLTMGIVNVTPDSFSGDGLLNREDCVKAALEQAETMLRDGADMIDIGGESTRPGSAPVSADEEIRRTVPVIRALHARFPKLPLSIDTMKTDVLDAALNAGATFANDVTGEAQNDAYFKTVAKHNAWLVVMHNGADPKDVAQTPAIGGEYRPPVYESDDCVEAVVASLKRLVARAESCGVAHDKIILDPGLGFGKNVEDNFRLARATPRFASLGFPVLIGGSRKSFLGRLNGSEPTDRADASVALAAIVGFLGATIVRVHDVRATATALKVAQALK